MASVTSRFLPSIVDRDLHNRFAGDYPSCETRTVQYPFFFRQYRWNRRRAASTHWRLSVMKPVFRWRRSQRRASRQSVLNTVHGDQQDVWQCGSWRHQQCRAGHLLSIWVVWTAYWRRRTSGAGPMLSGEQSVRYYVVSRMSSFSALTLFVGSFDSWNVKIRPRFDITYNMFGWTLNLAHRLHIQLC